MSYLNSPCYPDNLNEDFDSYDEEFDENESEDDNNNSDTEEASESEFNTGSHHRTNAEPIEIKEQMYQDKLANLKRQLEELETNQHPEYLRRLKKLEFQCHERLCLNDIQRNYLTECVERDYILEKKAASKEYEEKKADLKENLLSDFDEKRKLIETERHTMELMGDCMEVKPTITRKLRRRPNEPIPVAAEKRRKPPSGQLVLLLDEKEIEQDLKMILRGKPLTPVRPPSSNGMPSILQSPTYPMVETKIEDGKLLYERRWFHRGQPVYVEGKDIIKFAATISAIGNEIIWVKKLNDNNKVKIHTTQLARGKIAIKRRAN